MPPLTPDQRRKRERVETVIRIAAPALNLVLAVGDRLSRVAEREDHEYYPPRATGGALTDTSKRPGGAARAE